jgi:hypothetical protein
LVFAFGLAIPSFAQQDSAKFSVNADLVSSYVWRGITQGSTKGGSPNFQPSVTFTDAKFSIGSWGSGSFSGDVKEVDLFATYAFSDAFSVTVTDYNWNFTKSYFDYKNAETDHLYEGTLAFAGTKSFPLSASINTIFYGDDKNTKGNNAYSTYVELGYPLTKDTKAFLGASLLDSPGLYTPGKEKGFAVINVGIKSTKEIKVSQTFSLPVYGIVGVNPSAETAYFVVGISF